MILIFNQSKIPRTTTRAGWKEIWQWKRTTENKFHEYNLKLGLIACDRSLSLEVREDAAYRLANPPIVIYPNENDQHRRN